MSKSMVKSTTSLYSRDHRSGSGTFNAKIRAALCHPVQQVDIEELQCGDAALSGFRGGKEWVHHSALYLHSASGIGIEVLENSVFFFRGGSDTLEKEPKGIPVKGSLDVHVGHVQWLVVLLPLLCKDS